MSRRKKVLGTCKICGATGELSFDHVPPASAFNNRRYYYEASVEALLELDRKGEFPDMDGLIAKGLARKKQGGIGSHSLCGQCNNNTGSWYGSDFTKWVYQSMGILMKANGNPSLWYPTFFFPLRVFKQVLTMFLSMGDEHMRTDFPELVRFILDKEQRFLEPKFKVYVYYNLEGSSRYLQRTYMRNKMSDKNIVLSELTFPPFGFVLTIDSDKPSEELTTEITHFGRFEYNKSTDFYQKFPILPTHLPNVPADYRSRQDIQTAIASSMAYRRHQ